MPAELPGGGREATPALQCRQVSRFFGSFPALRNVSFRLERGRMLALLGSNGAGKSTLLRIIAGALRPTYGTVSIAGVELPGEGAKRQVGLLSHESFLHPALSVAENLAYYGQLYGIDDAPAAIAAAAERAGAQHLLKLRVAELSQGMRQKAALTRTLLHRPSLLLLDEPFASLDRASVASLLESLRQLRADGIALMISTHTEHLIESWADQFLHLERGMAISRQGIEGEAEGRRLDDHVAAAVTGREAAGGGRASQPALNQRGESANQGVDPRGVRR